MEGEAAIADLGAGRGLWCVIEYRVCVLVVGEGMGMRAGLRQAQAFDRLRHPVIVLGDVNDGRLAEMIDGGKPCCCYGREPEREPLMIDRGIAFFQKQSSI